MLTKNMKKFLLSPDAGYNKSLYYGRIEKYSLAALEDLALVAELLPEERLSKIFTPAKILPLIYHLLGRELKEKSERRYQLARLLAEWSLPMLREKMDKPLESFLWKDFLRVEEMIRTIIPDQGYIAETVDGKLVFKNAEKES